MIRGENEENNTTSSSLPKQQQELVEPGMKKIEDTATNSISTINNNIDYDNVNKQENLSQTAASSTAPTAATSLRNNNSADVTVSALLTLQDNNNANNNNSSSSPCWDNLPSVILLEIFSYLPQESRIQASQVCRHWRYALFHPSFWKKITFTLIDYDSIVWSRCLSSWFKFSVQDVTIRCESSNNCVREALYILKKLNGNRQLRKLLLEPSTCMFEYPNQEVNSDNMLKQLLNIVDTSNCLETVSLGCIEELTEDLTCILESLKHNHANNITHLSLASVKDDPDHYDFLELECSLFNYFHRLSVLTIDYDHVNDELLEALNSGNMERLVIHVHGWNGDYVGASNNAWAAFTQKNPRCKLRLNLIHSYNAVRVLNSDILQSAMPLSHLKVLFCESVNILALHLISDWYSNTLQSIVWIDSFNSQKSLMNSVYFDDPNNPDPLILAAWRCQNLSEIVFIGRKYMLDNLLAIVRLRSNTLKRLEFAESDIVYEDSLSEREAIVDEVKDVMGKHWKLMSDKELPKVVINPHCGDSREVIMPMVLRDQK